MKWKNPPKIKIYEALGCVGDGRIEADGNTAKVYSSSRGKFYTVNYDPESNAIMANDNGSFWQGYLGYPAIAFLMVKGLIEYSKKYADVLSGIAWKDINTKLKNDWEKTEQVVLELVKDRVDAHDVIGEVEKIQAQIIRLDLNLLGSKVKPPEGY